MYLSYFNIYFSANELVFTTMTHKGIASFFVSKQILIGIASLFIVIMVIVNSVLSRIPWVVTWKQAVVRQKLCLLRDILRGKYTFSV